MVTCCNRGGIYAPAGKSSSTVPFQTIFTIHHRNTIQFSTIRDREAHIDSITNLKLIAAVRFLLTARRRQQVQVANGSDPRALHELIGILLHLLYHMSLQSFDTLPLISPIQTRRHSQIGIRKRFTYLGGTLRELLAVRTHRDRTNVDTCTIQSLRLFKRLIGNL
ncbi:hypothetical protein IEQ34_004028 [Dendrobium chrysotoxum]|uniref:Uncharacterized protein n=1 Tax=Dendrobium chrysotoxum TaxID=161865 RepID=A0AAV7HHA0_DENCH|nr:hypothetical protein IEQ34_004028 [Dendrobium chrysotoxum]